MYPKKDKNHTEVTEKICHPTIKNQFGIFSALGLRPNHSGTENEEREKNLEI